MKNFFNFLIAFYPILSGYGFSPQADFGVFSIFIVGLICFFRNHSGSELVLPDGYKLFLVVAVLFTIVFARTIPLRLLLYSINLCMACMFVDYKILLRYYELIVYVCGLFFVIQVVALYTIGVHIVGIASFIPTIYEGSHIDIMTSLSEADRCSSLFLEPSYFAQYMFPYVVIKLFSSIKADMWKAIIVSALVLLSRSGMGLCLLLIIWTYWFFSGNIRLRTKVSVVMVASLAVLMVFRFNEEAFNKMLERTIEFQSFSGDEQYQSSGFIRFFRGYYAYADMPLMNKLFGANPELVESVLSSNVFFLASEDEAFNGTTTLLLYNGLFVCFLFFRHLVLMCWKKNNRVLVVMVLCCIWLMLGESYYLCARMFLTTILMYSLTTTINKQCPQLQ